MSSAAGGGDRSGGGDDGDGGNLQNNVAVAALAAALVALIVSTFQLLQQYYGSATGLASCNETVMGKWSVFTKRRFIWKEFRFQVCFSAPVLFVSPPSNTSGPLGKHENKEIVYLNGKTYDDSHTWTQEEYDMIREDGLAAHATRETVHTADNELSTWVGLLMAIQRMEQESAEWAKKIKTEVLSPAKKINTEVLSPAGYLPGLDQGAPDDGQHTLMVGMQIKQRTWDAMPSDLKKPYATSTMCHVVEILAMLGIHWRQFDRISNTYHAQGNGFIVTGSVVPSLGVAFTFEKAGKTWFQETRLVPNEKVKQLCFGYCPSIFQQLDLNVPLYADEAQDHGTLQLGTKAELAETLLSFDCNTNTINYFRLGNPHTRYSHLFPVAFEMLGMVGEVIHIHHTPFTMLPNPTGFTWDKSTMSLINMLNAFRKQLSQSLVEDHNGSKLAEVRDSPRIRRILQDAQLAVIDAGLERDFAQIEDAGLIAERYYRKNKTDRDKKDCEPQQKRQVIMTSAASPSPSSLISIIILVITVIALIFRPVIMLLRPLALLVVHVSSEVKDLLVKIDLIKDEHAEKVRKIARPLAPDAQPRPSKQTMINTLHDAIDRCDEFLRTNKMHTRYVFALHMEELMGYLNARPSYAHDDDDDLDDDDAAASDRAGLGPGMGLPDAGGPRNRTRTRRGYASSSTRISSPHPSDTGHYNSDYVPLHSIDVATWDERDALLMQVYIKFIRKRVVETEIPKTLKKYTAVTPDSPADWPGLLRQDSLSKEMRQTRLRELLDKMPKEGKKAAQVNFDNNTSAAPSQAPYQRVYRHSFRSRRHSRSHRVEPAAPQAQDTAQQDQDDAKLKEQLLKEQLKKALEELSQAILMDNEDNEPCTTSAGTPGASSSAGAAIATTTAAAAAAAGPSLVVDHNMWRGGSGSGSTSSTMAGPSADTSNHPLPVIAESDAPSPMPSPPPEAATSADTSPFDTAAAAAAAAATAAAFAIPSAAADQYRPPQPENTLHAETRPGSKLPAPGLTRVGTGGSNLTGHRGDRSIEYDRSPPNVSLTGTTGILMDILARQDRTSTPKAGLSAPPSGPTSVQAPAQPAAAAEAVRDTTAQDMHDIWCTLVLRMMLWLMLHDFHKKDVQISKSQVYGSRQPVYIL